MTIDLGSPKTGTWKEILFLTQLEKKSESRGISNEGQFPTLGTWKKKNWKKNNENKKWQLKSSPRERMKKFLQISPTKNKNSKTTRFNNKEQIGLEKRNFTIFGNSQNFQFLKFGEKKTFFF